MRQWMISVQVIMILAFASAAIGDSPMRPEPYLKALDEYIFVMMPGHCDRVTERLELTEKEYDAYLERIKEEKQSRQKISRSNPCFFGYKEPPHWARESSNMWDVTQNSYQWKIFDFATTPSGEAYPASGLYFFEMTRGGMLSIYEQEQGKSARLYIHGEIIVEPDTGDGFSSREILGIPFPYIASIARADATTQDQLYWTVSLKDGTENTVLVQDRGSALQFSGRDPSGTMVEVSGRDVKRLVFNE